MQKSVVLDIISVSCYLSYHLYFMHLILLLSLLYGQIISFHFTAGKPKVSLSFGPSYVENNKNITLPICHVTSFPPSVITWSKVHGNLVQARAVLRDGQLSIINAQKKDSGLYKCKASNILGQNSSVTHLSVVELPRFTVSAPSQLKVFPIQNITVPCQATGDPKPTVAWMKENGELPSGRSIVSVDGTLQIWNIKEEDSGRYTCTASSAVVFKASSVMTVRGKMSPPRYDSFTRVVILLVRVN